jgi:hypothetical protein
MAEAVSPCDLNELARVRRQHARLAWRSWRMCGASPWQVRSTFLGAKHLQTSLLMQAPMCPKCLLLDCSTRPPDRRLCGPLRPQL